MHSVERRGTNKLHSLVERHATINIVAQTLQVAKSGMSLIAVIHILSDTKLLQHQHTTNTQQDLLLQAVLPITTVERVSNGLVELRVHVVVCIEQVKLDTAYIDLPNQSVNLIVQVRHIHNHLIAVLVQHTLNGKRVEVLGVILGNLLAVHAQRLCKISEAIEETNTTKVYIRVRSLFQVIAGKHAQTS